MAAVYMMPPESVLSFHGSSIHDVTCVSMKFVSRTSQIVSVIMVWCDQYEGESVNGSQMEVMGLLCVSAGSITGKVSDVHAYIQRLVSVVRMETVLEECTSKWWQCLRSVLPNGDSAWGVYYQMATVLEECTTKEQRSIVRCLWAEGLNAKDIHREMFPVYCGECLSHEVVHS
jgi:hypothetical protein